MLETKDFFKAAKDRLALVKEADRDVIMQAAKMMGDCMEDNGVVQSPSRRRPPDGDPAVRRPDQCADPAGG